MEANGDRPAAMHVAIKRTSTAASEQSEPTSPSGASPRAAPGRRRLTAKLDSKLGQVTELGHIGNLTCPVLAKLGEAFLFSKRVWKGEKDNAIMKGSRCVVGVDAAVHVAYKPEGRVVIMSFKGTLLSPAEVLAAFQGGSFLQLGNDLTAPRALPSFLAGVSPEAEVHEVICRQFDSLLVARRRDGRGLVDTIKSLTGGATPRRIICCGYCTGGSVATLAAAWAALQVPTADVRCVTFGAPRVGNLAFVETFKWLVGCSYRVAYRKDSVPDKPTSLFLQHFHPVHGSIYLDQDGVQARARGLSEKVGTTKKDHAISLYSDALKAACTRNLDRKGGCTVGKQHAAAISAHGGAQREGGRLSLDNAAKQHKGGAAMLSDLAQMETAGPKHEDHNSDDEYPDGIPSCTLPMHAAEASHMEHNSDDEYPDGIPSCTLPMHAAEASHMEHNSDDEYPDGIPSCTLPMHAAEASHMEHNSDDEYPDRIPSCTLPMVAEATHTEHNSDDEYPDGVPSCTLPTFGSEAAHEGAAQQQAPPPAGLDRKQEAARQNFLAELERNSDEEYPEGAFRCPFASIDPPPDSAPQPMLAALPLPFLRRGSSAEGAASPRAVAPQPTSPHGGDLAPDVAAPVDDKGNEKRATALPSRGHRRSLSSMSGVSVDSTDVALNGAANGHAAQSRTAATGTTARDGGDGGEEAEGKLARSGSLAGGRKLLRSLSKGWLSCMGGGGEEDISAADRAYRQAVGAAAGTDTGLGTAAGAPRFLQRAFSLLEREDFEMDLGHLDALEKILVMGKISQASVVAWAAYRDPADFGELTGIPDAVLIEDTKFGTHAYIAWLEGGTAVFAFRGTEDAQDSWQDIKLARRSIPYLEQYYPGTKAHLGFQQQFAAVLDPERPEFNIGEVLMKLSGGQKPTRVLTCGHSLGGAVATLAAAWAALQYTQADVRCITFGSPRVGNAKFKRAFHTLVNTSFRLVYSADPIPAVPPSFRYKHVGGSIFLSKRGMQLRSRPWHWKYRFNVMDHFTDKYDRALLALMPAAAA